MRYLLLSWVIAMGLAGCGGDDGGGGGDEDSGPAPGVDAGPMPGVDSGPMPEVDSGPAPGMDAGPMPGVDAGPTPRVDAGPGGAVCGTRGTGPCPMGEFCDWPRGANCGRADAPGVCRPIPEVCSGLFMPVCGCDGSTYSNECVANSMGVSVESDGECM